MGGGGGYPTYTLNPKSYPSVTEWGQYPRLRHYPMLSQILHEAAHSTPAHPTTQGLGFEVRVRGSGFREKGLGKRV